MRFPESFSEAPNKLRLKFRTLDRDTIEDGIQNALIEYWYQNIQSSIPNESEALGWFLNVAFRYLYKEIDRKKKLCPLSLTESELIADDFEIHFICYHLLDSLKEKLSPSGTSIVFKHAMGYSLKELAQSENISLGAMRQRHARERRLLKREIRHLYY